MRAQVAYSDKGSNGWHPMGVGGSIPLLPLTIKLIL